MCLSDYYRVKITFKTISKAFLTKCLLKKSKSIQDIYRFE